MKLARDDVRNSMCYECLCFIKEEFGNAYKCLKDNSTLRMSRNKVPQKNQSCGGPYYSMDELKGLSPDNAEMLAVLLEKGKVVKDPITE